MSLFHVFFDIHGTVKNTDYVYLFSRFYPVSDTIMVVEENSYILF